MLWIINVNDESQAFDTFCLGPGEQEDMPEDMYRIPQLIFQFTMWFFLNLNSHLSEPLLFELRDIPTPLPRLWDERNIN